MPYAAMQQMLDVAAPFGLRSYWKSNFLRELPDEAIDTFVRCAERCPSPRTFVILEHAHGAATRVAGDATAFPARGHAFDLVMLSLWSQAADDAPNVAWTREFYDAMHPWSAMTVYVNTLSEDDGARVGAAYGANDARLARVKARYDLANRFRRNQNIPPAGSEGRVGEALYATSATRSGDVSA